MCTTEDLCCFSIWLSTAGWRGFCPRPRPKTHAPLPRYRGLSDVRPYREEGNPMDPKNKSSRLATDADKKIGKRLRKLRKAKGYSLEEVARLIGLSYQQVQKYETGQNRISAVRLWQFARLYQVDIRSFFRG